MKSNRYIQFVNDRIDLPDNMYWEIDVYDDCGKFRRAGNIKFKDFPQAICFGRRGDKFLFHLIPSNSYTPITAYCKILTK